MSRPEREVVFSRPHGPDPVRAVRFLRTGARDPTWRFGRGEVAHAVWTARGPATVWLRVRGEDVAARAWGPGADEALGEVAGWLGAGDAPEAFQPPGRRVTRLVERHGVAPMPRYPFVAETAVRVICQQRVTWQEATRSWRLLCERFGEPAPGPLALQTPPDPTRLARQPYEVFHPLGIERSRALRVHEVARRCEALDALAHVDVGEARTVLGRVPGLGPWSVPMITGSSLQDADAVPVGDFQLPHTVAWALEGTPRSDDDRMIALLEPFRPHRWRVVRLLLDAGISAPRRGPGIRSRWSRDA